MRVEAKLLAVSSRRGSQQDSGFGSSSSSSRPHYPSQPSHYGIDEGSLVEERSEDTEDEDEFERQGREMFSPDEDNVSYELVSDDEAGRGLLWGTSQASSVSSLEGERPVETPISCSPSTRIIPPTPSTLPKTRWSTVEGVNGEVETPRRRVPLGLTEEMNSRRISFSDSVRISGGIKTKSTTRRRLSIDLFSPPSGSSHRPSNSVEYHGRDISASSSLGAGLVSNLPSRSSSPCSSIYAPLSQPSATCPQIRPPVPTSSKLISFADYLRGRSEEDEAESVKGYRDLVEQQRRRKGRSNSGGGEIVEEKSGGGGAVWNSVKEFLAGMPLGRSRLGGRSELSGSREGGESSRNPNSTNRKSPRRVASTLSISSEADDERDETSPIVVVRSSQRNYGATTARRISSSSQPVKSETDVRFGQAPARYFRLSWWRYAAYRQTMGVRAAVCGCFGGGEDESYR